MIVVGAGLAGLVATAELADAGRRVLAGRPGARGVARRAGVLVVRRPVPRRQPRAAPAAHQGLARAGLAGLARHRGVRPRRRTSGRGGGPRPTWTSPPARSGPGCRSRASRLLPIVGWAERGGYGAIGHGNSVPRFHITWGTGPGVVEPFAAPRARRAAARPRRAPLPPPRRRARPSSGGAVDGVAGEVLAPDACARGQSSNRDEAGDFELARPGRDRHLRRHRRQPRARAPQLAASGSATPPEHMISGVPAHVDGRMIEITQARRRQRDQPRPHVALHRGHPATGTRSGRCTASASSPARRRCGSTRPASGCRSPLFPGFDTLGTLAHIMTHGPRPHVVRADPEDHREGVRAVRLRAEPGHHRTRACASCCATRVGVGRARRRSRRSSATAPTSWSSATCARSSTGMNRLTDEPLLDLAQVEARGRRPRPRDATTRTRRTCR